MTEVLVYATASRAETARLLLAAACRATGLSARLEVYGTGSMYQRLGPRHAQPLPDVVLWFGPFAADAAARDGLLQPYQPAHVADAAMHDQGWRWTTLDYQQIGVVGPQISGLQNLRGVPSLAIADPERSEVGLSIVLATLDQARQVDKDVEHGWTWWQQRVQNGIRSAQDDAGAVAMVAHGAASHAISLVEAATPLGGLSPLPNTIGLAASARNVDGGKRLIDWLTSEQAGATLRLSPWQASSNGLQSLLSAAPGARRRLGSRAIRRNASALGSEWFRAACAASACPGPSAVAVRRLADQLPAVALCVALTLPFAAYATIGSFARYTADDYCWAGVLRTEGFFRAQALWYTGYSPRYAFTFLVNVVELAGPAIVPALPTVAIVVWLATLTWTFAQFNVRLVGLPTLTSAVVLAEIAAFSTFQTAPDLPQSLYWQTGMLTYLLPLVLATFLIGWIRLAFQTRHLSALWRLAITALVTFVAGGLAETYLIPQNVALTLALLVALGLALRGEIGWVVPAHLVAGLAGGVIALVVILVAPSTASRVGGTPADLWLALSASIATAAFQVRQLLRFSPLIVLLSVGLPALLGDAPYRISRRWFLLVTACAAITAIFCYFPSFYAQNGNPPTRSLIVPAAIYVGYSMFVGYTLQGLTQRLPASARFGASVALALVPVAIVATTLSEQVSAAQSAAARWDTEDQQIRASRDAGEIDVTVPDLPPYLGEKFVTANPQDWFNVCVARYYGVRSIAATTSAASSPAT